MKLYQVIFDDGSVMYVKDIKKITSEYHCVLVGHFMTEPEIDDMKKETWKQALQNVINNCQSHINLLR